MVKIEHKYITGIRNVDYLIYNKLDDLSLYRLCLSSKTKSEICKDDGYFKYRIRTYYGENIVNNKPNNITYKQQYIDIIKVLYKDGIKGDRDPYYGRIDLLLAANLIYGWKPDDFNMRSIAGQGDVTVFLLACDIFNYEPLEVLSQYINSVYDHDRDQTAMMMYIIDKYEIYPDVDTIDRMCEKKYLELLKYLSERGHNPSRHGFNYAVRGGNMEIINWLHQHLGLIPSDKTLEFAIKGQHTDIFIWLMNEFSLEPSEDLTDVALEEGNLDVFKILTEIHQFFSNDEIIISALRNNKLDILKYLWTTYKIRPARTVVSEINNIESLKWYVNTFNRKISQASINTAMIFGHFDILIWGYNEFELLPDEISRNVGARYGYTDIIKWLDGLGVLLDPNEIIYEINEIAGKGHLDLCIFIYEKYDIRPDQEGADMAMRYTSFPVIHWLDVEFGIKPNVNIEEEEED